MKFLLILALLYIVYKLVTRAARKPGKLNHDANRAVAAAANTARYFIIGIWLMCAVALGAYVWSVI